MPILNSPCWSLFRSLYARRALQNIDLKQRSRLYRLIDSLFYYTMSRSELLCYSAMVLNHLLSGTLLSIPLPLSIFLWAMLSSRPSRNYWITILTYTEAMIVVEYIFQFRFYPWNTGTTDTRPMIAINIIGISRKASGASFTDLILLLSLFLHRSILKVRHYRHIHHCRNSPAFVSSLSSNWDSGERT